MQFLEDMYYLITLFYNQNLIDKTVGSSVTAVMEGNGGSLGKELLIAALILLAVGLIIDYVLYFLRTDVRFRQTGIIGRLRAGKQKRIV